MWKKNKGGKMKKVFIIMLLVTLVFNAWGQTDDPKVEDYVGWFIVSHTEYRITTNIEGFEAIPDQVPVIMQINDTVIIRYSNNGEIVQYMLLSPDSDIAKGLGLEIFNGL
jgi:hypothetical protein